MGTAVADRESLLLISNDLIESQSPGARRGFFSVPVEPISEFVFASVCIGDLHPETNYAVMT